MTKNKLRKFSELKTFSNVLQRDKVNREAREGVLGYQENIKKKLLQFIESDEVIIELACGRGDYTIGLAQEFPNKKVIGIDIQGERIWYGAKYALENNLDNVLFLRIYIDDLLEYFPQHCINEIWITFPDPFPKKRHTKKRLTFEKFLKMYQQVLKPNGKVTLKTDDQSLFEYSKESIIEFGGKILQINDDIYQNREDNPLLYIQTHYEKKHLAAGRTIKYLQFSFT